MSVYPVSMTAKQPLSVTHPELAKEADGWDPKTITAGSGKKQKWICPIGHRYEAVVASRAGSNTGCSICSGNKVLVGFNDFESRYPQLAKEAVDWDPQSLTFGSGKKLKWMCHLGHIFEASIVSRTSRKSGCPICSNNQVLPGYNDLATINPDLAKEAYGWDPTSLKPMSGKNVEWKCSKGHIFQSIVANRSKGVGCGVCANRVIVPGINDLTTLYPELAAQADGWDPKTVGAGSHKRLRWKCKSGHTWETNPKHRVSGTGCPVCGGQKIVMGINDLFTTNPEIAAQAFGWDPSKILARHHQKYSWKCSSGHIWETTVTARKSGSGCLVCTGKQVSVPHNSLPVEYPEIAKQAYGWDPETVMAKSGKRKEWKCSVGHIWTSTVSNRTSGAGCPYCSNQKVLVGFNDLQSTHPELAKEADGWNPKTKIAGSNKKLPWICSKNHRWNAVLASRALGGNGCPYCSGLKVLLGFNDLQTTNPEIAREAFGWDPSQVSGGNHKLFSWICPSGHEYKARIDHRRSGVSNCHYCSGHRVLQGFNDLQTLNPELAKEAVGWDPSTVTTGSSLRRKWRCNEGHSWTTSVADRKKSGCPTCAQTGFDPNKNGWLYFMEHESLGYLQIGITNSPEDRLKRHAKFGWELLQLRGPMDGHLTANWETSILRMLRAKNARMGPGKADINKISKANSKAYVGTEMWLKESFQAKSINELMRLTEEFEA